MDHDDETKYRLEIFFTNGTTQVIINVSREGLDEWNQQMLSGVPFLNEIDNIPWYFDPEHIFRVKATVYNKPTVRQVS